MCKIEGIRHLLQGYFPQEKCQIHGTGLYYNSDRCSQTHFGNACRMAQESQIVICSQNERTMTLQDENAILKKRVIDLKKQLSDLSTANEFLLDQNAQLRIGRKAGGVGTVTPVNLTVNGTPVSVQPMSQMPAPSGTAQLVAGTSVNVQLPGQASTGQLVTMSSQNASGQQLVPVSIAPGELTINMLKNPTILKI